MCHCSGGPTACPDALRGGCHTMTWARRMALVGSPPPPPQKKTQVFPNKPCFQVTWNQPGCCVPPHWHGTIATLVPLRTNPRSGVWGHREVPPGGTGEGMRGRWEDASSQPRSWDMGPVPSPATCPTPQTPSCLLHPPASALPLTRGSPRGRQDDSGEGFPRERVCFMPGRRTCPAPEHLLSPLQKKNNPKPPETGGGGHSNTPPPRASCATTRCEPRAFAEAESHKRKVWETGLWCQRILGWPRRCPCPPPVLQEDTRTRSPAGSALSPQEVLRCELRGGGSALPARPPSVHAQVREFHLVDRDGVVLGLAVGGGDGARRAWRWPENTGDGGNEAKPGFIPARNSSIQKTHVPAPLQVSQCHQSRGELG